MKIYIPCEAARFDSYRNWAMEQGARAVNPEFAEEIWVFVIDGNLPKLSDYPAVPRKYFAVDIRGIMMEITPLPHLPSDSIPTRDDLLTPDQSAAETNLDLERLARRLREGRITQAAYDRAVDKICGSTLEPRDADVEAEYERRRAGE